jgi:hypothetical protein
MVMRRITVSGWLVVVVTVVVVLDLMAFAIGLIGIYVADEYMTPAFSEQSFPQPKRY